MKLLFCIKSMNNEGGGAERVLACIANELVANGTEVSILSFDEPEGISFYPLNRSIKRIKLGIGDTNKPSSLILTCLRILAIRKKVSDLKPDIVIGFMHSMFIPLSFSLIGTKFPIIASEHIVPKHYEKKWLEFFLLTISMKFIKKMTVVSLQVKKSFPLSLQSKMVVINNPVNMPKLELADELQDKNYLILAVGRLEPQKGFDIAINAFAKLVKKHPNWRLKIVGEGSLRNELERLISTKKLTNFVSLPGASNNIQKEYKNASFLVVPSLYESFGLSVAEALACKLPIIAFADCQGVNEMVTSDFNGVLVSEIGNKTENFADAIEDLIKNSKKLKILSENACLPKGHDTKKIVNDWQNLFSSL